MKAATLLPLLAALTSTLALTEHPHAEALARRINPRRHHAHEVERMIQKIQEREAAEAAAPAVQKRQIIKKGQTCRPRQQSAAAVPSSSTTTSSSTAQSSPSASAASGGDSGSNNNNAAASVAATSAAAAATTSKAASSGTSNQGSNSGSLTPNGKKAGMSAGDSVSSLSGLLGWYYTWDASDAWNNFGGNPLFVPMLWGQGTTDSKDASRLADFKSLSYSPAYIMGPNEPDCSSGGDMSSGMSVAATAALWNSVIVPKGSGSLLLSPAMCKQKDENGWLKEFQGQITRDFDITAVHINKNNIAAAKSVVDYYWNTYGKPIWITEFACVDDQNGFTPCTDQGQINQYINDFVDMAESDSRVYAYAYSNGNGLGNVWPSWSGNGLSQSGQTYKSALQKYYH